MSATYIANINANGNNHTLHADFGTDPTYGIPYVTVTNAQALVDVTFDYDEDSDPGPYPIPPTAPVEGAGEEGDQHVLVLNTDNCKLYEMWDSEYLGAASGNAWHAGSGAIFDLNSNALRTDGFTSADAAGLPILPGLARCDEAMSPNGITHALRFTVNRTQAAHIYPATHDASNNTGADYPPMGLRLRLKGDYDISGFTGQSLAIAKALKQYGMMLADNGSNWYISGGADVNNPGCWDDDDLEQLKDVPGTAFEVVSIISPPAQSVSKIYYQTSIPNLTWTPITSATGYQLQVSRSATFAGASTLSSPTTNYSFLSNPLDNGIYYWHVRATGSTTWSPTETITIHAP
jgi:hypothetical protein